MKTYHIKDLLKKDLLALELARLEYYEVLKDGIYIKDHESGERDFIKGSYTLLGKPDEITEEDAAELVEFGYNNEKFTERYRERDYKNYSEKGKVYFETAKESLLSYLESEIHWVNPYGERNPVIELNFPYLADSQEERRVSWKQAELRTFNRTRTLIFVKN